MRKASPRSDCLTARQAARIINEVADEKVRRSLKLAGLSPNSAPRRRHDQLTGRVLKMIRRPVHKWDTRLLDKLLDAQADLRARYQRLEASFGK